MKYFKNSGWMLGEYMVKIFAAIFVNIYIARYLGPERFGVLSYILAVVSVFFVVAKLGLDGILVRDLALFPAHRSEYMSTGFSLILLSSLLSYFVVGVGVWFFEGSQVVVVAILVLASGFFFQASSVIDYGFQSQVKARYSALSKTVALFFSSIIKVYLVWIDAGFMAFICAFLLDHVLISFCLLFAHIVTGQDRFYLYINRDIAISMLKGAWPILLSSLASVLYMRIDQLMINSMLGAESLGLYAAAIKIYEGWILVPMVLSVSLLPMIVELKAGSKDEYTVYMTRLFAFVFWLGVLAAIVATIFGEKIIILTFGGQFVNAVDSFVVVMWSAGFTAIGSMTARYLMVERMEKKIAIRTILALLLNVMLNFLLIPRFGILGASVATLATVVFANYLMNYADKELVGLRLICNGAILLKLGRNR